MEKTPQSNIESLIENRHMQFRDFKLTAVETRALEDDTSEEYILEGKACSFDSETVLYKDKDYEAREVIDPKAFEGCDMTDVIFNFNHSGRVFSRTRNNTLELEIRTDGLYMRAHLKKGDNGHEELYRDIQSGLIDKMSFAFTVKEDEVTYTHGDIDVVTRRITAIDKLYDVSAVDIPAYDSTEISARNVFTVNVEKIKEEKRKLDLAKARFFYC